MKEILKEWANFKKAQEEARQKVNERMLLWNKENPYTGGFGRFNGYDIYEIGRQMEEFELKRRFGVVEITLENLLNSLIYQDIKE